MSKLLILGAGGHGRVVAEEAELENRWDEISFLDARDDIKSIYNFNIVGKIEDYSNFNHEYKYAFVAIGNNEKRIELIDKLINSGYDIPKIVHPKAYVSKYSIIKEGTVILPGAMVNTGSKLGKGCIVNINSCIDHDCEIGDGVHISTGAVIRSMGRIGKLSFLGAGALVRESSCVEDYFNLPSGGIF